MAQAVLSREDFLRCLAEPKSDQERSHARAEASLCAYWRGIGEHELADAWDKARDEQEWWYA